MVAFSKPRGLMGVLLTAFALLQATAAFHHAGAGHMHVARSVESMEAHLQETRSLLAARAGNIAITGAADGGQYPRLEIRDLQKNSDQWNLFLLAIEHFQAKDKNDPLSWYQIAGKLETLFLESTADCSRCSRPSFHSVESGWFPAASGWLLPPWPDPLRYLAQAVPCYLRGTQHRHSVD